MTGRGDDDLVRGIGVHREGQARTGHCDLRLQRNQSDSRNSKGVSNPNQADAPAPGRPE